MRYFAELEYDGTCFKGWQRQRDAASVQQILEDAFSTVLRSAVSLTGAGRTDTGVHARYYVAHIDLEQPIAEVPKVLYHVNSILPASVAVQSLTPVAESAHARFDAISREYTYRITTRKDALLSRCAWNCPYPLDMNLMNQAASVLPGTREFTAFSKLHSNNRTDICRVTLAQWTQNGHELRFVIRADRFLRNMVRSIVGSLTDVGRGKMSPEQFARILDSRNRQLATASAPAHGLFLTDVVYPTDVFVGSRNPEGLF